MKRNFEASGDAATRGASATPSEASSSGGVKPDLARVAQEERQREAPPSMKHKRKASLGAQQLEGVAKEQVQDRQKKKKTITTRLPNTSRTRTRLLPCKLFDKVPNQYPTAYEGGHFISVRKK